MIRGRGGPNPFGFAQPPPPHFHHHHIPELQDVNGMLFGYFFVKQSQFKQF